MTDVDNDVENLALRHESAVLQRQIDKPGSPSRTEPSLPPSCTDYHGQRCGSYI